MSTITAMGGVGCEVIPGTYVLKRWTIHAKQNLTFKLLVDNETEEDDGYMERVRETCGSLINFAYLVAKDVNQHREFMGSLPP